MEFLAEMNWIAIVVSTIVSMVIGFIWYSEGVFGKLWMKLNNISDSEKEAAKEKGMGKQLFCGFITTFILIGSYNFTLWATGINPYCIAALVIIGFVVPMHATASNWENRPWELFWINVGHWAVAILATATIFMMWN